MFDSLSFGFIVGVYNVSDLTDFKIAGIGIEHLWSICVLSHIVYRGIFGGYLIYYRMFQRTNTFQLVLTLLGINEFHEVYLMHLNAASSPVCARE